MIYRHRNLSNIPDLQDGDVVDMSNLVHIDGCGMQPVEEVK